MLQSSLRSARLLSSKPIALAARRQLPIAVSRLGFPLDHRHYATTKPPKPEDVRPPVMPTSETQTSERSPPPSTIDDVGETKVVQTPLMPPSPPTESKHTATEDDVGESSLQGTKIHPLAGGKPRPTATEDDFGESSLAGSKIHPLAGGKPKPPATIDDVGESRAAHGDVDPLAPGVNPGASRVAQETAAAPPLPPSPLKKGFFRRLRNFVFTLMVLGAVGFSGGVWYSRINDNFHDIFTEFVPFGEQAVLYLEEKEFRSKYPNANRTTSKPRPIDDSVKIPAQSGASWRMADGANSGNRHSNASPAPAPKPAAPKKTSPDDADRTSSPKPAELERTQIAENPAEKTAPQKPAQAPPNVRKASTSTGTSQPAGFRAPEVDEPSKFPPLKPIDLMELSDAKEPVVRDLVHMLNDLILVINADEAQGKYGTSVNKAKGEVSRIGGRLRDMKTGVEKKAAKEVKFKVAEFDKAATELIERVERAMTGQEVQWRQEFESEMEKVKKSYDDRVKLLLEREQQLSEEKLKNQLLEQAVALKKDFTRDVKTQVEQERDSRLGQLKELSSAVEELEKLTVGWNDVVDSNLQTQQLHLAVEAVRASLEDSQHPRPFIRELVALKEIAADDPIVDAAIASVNPSAYQRGIPTSAQLIDRFRRVAGEVRKASLLPEEAGVASHASSWLLSHVMFKKQGLAEGNDVESILTRSQTYLEEGDLDAAAREVNDLQGWAKTLSKDWLSEARKVLEVQQALDVIATEARLQSLRVD